jgi:hypothetical protein
MFSRVHEELRNRYVWLAVNKMRFACVLMLPTDEIVITGCGRQEFCRRAIDRHLFIYPYAACAAFRLTSTGAVMLFQRNIRLARKPAIATLLAAGCLPR